MSDDSENNHFHSRLSELMDKYVETIYNHTKSFPKEEMYGVSSQLRRSALSIPLNYTEGYARQRKAVMKNFIEISYGSLKESLYLVKFSEKQAYIKRSDAGKLIEIGDEIGKMLWGILKRL